MFRAPAHILHCSGCGKVLYGAAALEVYDSQHATWQQTRAREPRLLINTTPLGDLTLDNIRARLKGAHGPIPVLVS